MLVVAISAQLQHPFSVHLYSLSSKSRYLSSLTSSHFYGEIVGRPGKCFVQCLAVMVDPLRSVDFVARGEEGSESECLFLLNDVMEKWTDVVEKRSPGTEYKMAYLSRKHLTEHRYQPAAYSEEAVEKAKRNGPSAFVAYDYEQAETLTDLLVFPPGEQHPASNKPAIVREHAETLTDLLVFPPGEQHPTLPLISLPLFVPSWYELGLELGFTDAQITEYTYNKAEGSGKLSVLLQRKANEVSPDILEDLILNACKTIPSPIYGNVKDEVDTLVAADAERLHTED